MPRNADGGYTYGPGDEAMLQHENELRENAGLPLLSMGDTIARADMQDARSDEEMAAAAQSGSVLNIFNAAGLTPSTIDKGAPGASLDTSQADAARDRMGALLSQLQQQAATGGGAWEKTFADATRRAMSTAQAIGQSRPGANVQSSLRNIGNAQSAVSQAAVSEEEKLRSRAKLDAQQQMGGLLGAMGAGDIEQASAVAKAERERRAANQALIDQSLENRQATANATSMGLLRASDGGRVPGRARVFGDDSRNDTVPAKLSPGEIVIPRSIAAAPNAPELAAEFVRALRAADSIKARRGYADGGGVRPVTADEMGGAGNVALNFLAPHIGRALTYDALRKSVGSGGGGTLDTRAFEATRGARSALSDALMANAAGAGPSVASPMLQQSTDATIAAALGAQQTGRATAPDVLSAVGGAGVGAATDAATQRAIEQSMGARQYGDVLGQARGQESMLAGLARQAAWEKTLADAGLHLKNQAMLRSALAGAGQVAAAGAQAGWFGGPGAGASGGDGYSGPYQADYYGERGGAADIAAGENEKAHGGVIHGYADGGLADSGSDEPTTEAERAMAAAQAEADLAFDKRQAIARSDYEIGIKRRAIEAGLTPEQYLARLRSGEPIPKWKPPKSMTGAELGLPGGIPAGATFSLAPVAPSASPAGPTMAPPAKRTLVEVGRTDTGEPINEIRTGYVLPDIPGLRRDKPPPGAATPTQQNGAGVAGPLLGGASPKIVAEQEAAHRQTGDAEAMRARAEVEGAKARADAIEKAQLERKADLERARQSAAEAANRLQRAQEEASSIDGKLDPGRFWASRSTGDKVLGILGMVLGALGAGPDGQNRAAQMLQHAIDRDLETQKAEHEIRLRKGQQSVAAAQNFYSMAYQATRDELAAKDASRAMALDMTAARGEQLIAATKEPEARAKLAGLVAALHAQAAEHRANAIRRAEEAALEAKKVGGSQAKQDKQLTEIEERETEIQQSGTKLLQLIDAYGTGESNVLGTPGVEAQMRQSASGMIIAASKMQDREGVVREADEKREAAALGFEPGWLRNAKGAKAAIQSYMANAERRRQNAYQARGLVAPQQPQAATK